MFPEHEIWYIPVENMYSEGTLSQIFNIGSSIYSMKSKHSTYHEKSIKIFPVFFFLQRNNTYIYQHFETRFPPNKCYQYACKDLKGSVPYQANNLEIKKKVEK